MFRLTFERDDHQRLWANAWFYRDDIEEVQSRVIAEAYGGQGGNEEQDINARTGCVCCPLASRDTALDAVIANPSWAYLAPLKEIRDLYRWLREPENRLRKPGGERRKDGSLVANQQRMGPITFSARLEGLSRLLDIQNRVNQAAVRLGRPKVDHLNSEEESRIRELIAAGTWPNGWDGNEPTADTILPTYYADGSIMHHLFGDLD